MNKILLASTASLCLAAGPLLAADGQQGAYAWTGPYVGVNAGYSWANRSTQIVGLTGNGPNFVANGNVASVLDAKRSGFLGGIQGGYNYQVNSSTVIGIEVDISTGNVRGSASIPGTADNSRIMTTHQELDWLGTARIRAGFVASNRWLVYVTGGAAFGDANLQTALTRTSGCAGNNCQRGQTSETRFGWTVGAGAEHALSRNFSIKAEYLYYDLGRLSHLMTDPAFPATTFSAHAKFDGHVARIGINYRF